MKINALYYITSNSRKVAAADKFLSPLGLIVEQKSIHLLEIQSENIEEIAVFKAKQAYEQLKHPLFVNDAGWYIPAYNGFPGPFMKYMDTWLTSDDFLHLMSVKKDRRILFKEVVCYIDESGTKTFQEETEGKFVSEQRGKTAYQALDTVVCLSPTGKTISECWDEGIRPGEYIIWKRFAEWLQDKTK